MVRREFPALGFDPAPGDPAVVRAAAGSVDRAGRTFADASGHVHSLSTSSWTGDAADAFRSRLEELPRDLDAASRSHAAAARALDEFGSGLSARQARADQLEESAEELLRRRAAAVADVDRLAGRRAPDGSAELAGLRSQYAGAAVRAQELSSELEQVLADARRLHHEHRSAADAAGRAIRAASEVPYPEPGWLSRAGDAVSGWIRKHSAVLARISTTLKGVSTVLGLLSMVPGLQFLAPFAALAAGVAIVIDIGLKAATGRGSWASIGLDAVLTFMPWGRVATLVRRLPAGARTLDAAGGLVSRVHGGASRVVEDVDDAAGSVGLLRRGPARDWPTDPRTGAPLSERDLGFLQWRPEQWMRGEAPLGMTPADYQQWRSSLLDVLGREGVPPDAVDVRLLGSGSEGFSGPHKPMWSQADQQIAADPEARSRLAHWVGEDPDRFGSRPFDSGYRLGVDEPSDYDINLSSDAMVARARELWEQRGRPGDLFSGAHQYVNKEIAAEAFPGLDAWRRQWSERLGPAPGDGRDMSWAVFPSSGPKDVSVNGFFVHFRDDYDWIVHRPQGSA